MTLIEALMLGLLTLVSLLLLLLWLQMRRPQGQGAELAAHLSPVVVQSSERLERELRDELTRSAGGTRQELLVQLRSVGQLDLSRV
jgi:DNA recombination protein RmuC